MNVFLKRALIAAPISLVWVVLFTPIGGGNIFSLLGSWVGAFCLVYVVIMIFGAFVKPKKPVMDKPDTNSEDELFEELPRNSQ